MIWTGLVWLRIGPVEGSCEHGNKPAGSIKCWAVRVAAQPVTSRVVLSSVHFVAKDVKELTYDLRKYFKIGTLVVFLILKELKIVDYPYYCSISFSLL
jgi:hypothetical protein